MVGTNGIRGRLAGGGWRFDVAKGTLDSAICNPYSVLRNPYSVLCLSQVGLTAPVGRELRDTDQQGRWSLPKGIEVGLTVPVGRRLSGRGN